MQTLSSATVQANFGHALDLAKGGEPVTITQYGRPTVMLFSYKDGAELLRLRSATALESYFTQRQASLPVDAPALSMDEIDQLVDELRA
jgi:prevent-host-death family protein